MHFAVCTTGFDKPFLSTCMKKGGCTVLIGKNRHSYHTNLNDIHKSFWGLQVIHFWSLTLHLWHNWTYHFEVHTQCNPFLYFFFSLSPTILLDKIFAEHAAVKRSQVNGHTLTTSRGFHALEGDIVTQSLSPLMEITMNIHRVGVCGLPFNTPACKCVHTRSEQLHNQELALKILTSCNCVNPPRVKGHFYCY